MTMKKKKEKVVKREVGGQGGGRRMSADLRSVAVQPRIAEITL